MDLARFGPLGIEQLQERVRWDPTESPDGYRNRIRLRILETGQPVFFNPEKSFECAVLEPSLSSALRGAASPPEQTRRALSLFSHLELRAADEDGRLGLYLGGPRFRVPGHSPGVTHQSLCSALRPWLEDLGRDATGVVFAAEGITPESEWPSCRTASIDGVWLEVPVGGFVQVNHVINRALVRRVRDHARGAHESVVDLYCGSGNFLLPLCRSGLVGGGVEVQPRALASARRAASAQGLAVELHAGTTLDWLNDRLRQGVRPPTLAIVDPPRAGLKEALGPLSSWKPQQIAYCSCNPSSLAHDLGQLQADGYRLQAVELFDMFPHTTHVEALAWLKLG